jgi:peroxiredoxin Q/BCP
MQHPPYQAPNFKLTDQEGITHELSDYAGKWLVLYFYPKDDTPGCTLEACSFRDGRDDIREQTGAEIVGISKDDETSHQDFISKYNLNFTLLSDPKGKVVEEYGAWGKNRFGSLEVLRKTFLIDPEGNVAKVYGRVTPDGHSNKVLEDLKKLSKV